MFEVWEYYIKIENKWWKSKIKDKIFYDKGMRIYL